MKDILIRSLTWWNGQTWGTALFTRRHGTFVGEDELGNRYYRGPMFKRDESTGPERRWVVFNGEAEASRVPPGWRGWLAHTFDIPPSEDRYVAREWEKPHQPNLTGTPRAYRPAGSTLARSERPPATGDYLAWSPDGWAPAGRDEDGVSPDGRDVRRPEQHPGTHGVGLGQPQHG
ncbi:MAG: NADH:ubiquinone oxidoreductase subunit NDUFA12 [Methylobacteriaceae bacterium]|nr:NADH:ubiquinone oxidoreductase subunit NDUFA12 [Methylobacteriaceae bacterium]